MNPNWGAAIAALDAQQARESTEELVHALAQEPSGLLALDALRGTLNEVRWRGTLASGLAEHHPRADLFARTRARLRAVPELAYPPPSGPLPRVAVGWGTYGYKGAPGLVTEAVVRRVPLIDTAPTYGYGRVEKALGGAFRALHIASQVDTWMATKVSRNHMSRAAATNSGRRSRETLGRVDLLQVHWPNAAVPIAETMRAFADLRDAGTVRAIGVCNCSLDQIISAQAALPGGYRIDTVQARYHYTDREAEGVLVPFAAAHGLRFIAYSPLGQGASLGVHPRKALAWLLERGTLPIPATNDSLHLRANLAVGNA